MDASIDGEYELIDGWLKKTDSHKHEIQRTRTESATSDFINVS
jgi:hypothetical protein